MNIKKKMLIPFATLALVLVGCGGTNEPTYPVVTFRQARGADVRVVVKGGMTQADFEKQIPDFVYDPVSQPTGWYEARWFGMPASVEDVKADMTVNAVFDAKIFNAHFKLTEDGAGAETVVPFTFLDYKMNPNKLRSEPAVPAKTAKNWYAGNWSSYTLATRDITILPQYNENQFTATFVDALDVPVATKSFTVQDYNARPDHRFAEEPEVPEIEGYIGTWEEYELTAEDITIRPVYEPIVVTVTFPDDTTMELEYGEEYKITKAVTSLAGYEKYAAYESYLGWMLPDGSFFPTEGISTFKEDIDLSAGLKHVTFDSSADLSLMTPFRGTTTIDSTVKIEGEGSLKLTGTMWNMGINIAADFLELAFKNPAVKSVSLYALASKDTNDFGYRYNTASPTMRKFYLDKTGWGVSSTIWRRFDIPRAEYEAHKAEGINDLVYTGGTVPTIWIDDLYADVVDQTLVCGFENTGKITQPTEDNKAGRVTPFDKEEEKYSFFSNNDTFTVKDFEINHDPEFVLEGHSSLKCFKTWQYKSDGVNKNYYAAFQCDTRLIQACGENDTLEFDVYAADELLSNDVKDGKNNVMHPLLNGQWNHYSVPKAGLDEWGRFFIINGSQCEGHLYFDNIHIVRGM